MSLLLAFVLKHWRWVALAAFLAAVAGASLYRVYQWGKSEGDAEVKAMKAALAEAQAEEAIQKAQESKEARRKEQALADQLAKADAQHVQDLQDAKARSAGTVADLKSGNLKLRKQWQACLSQAGAATADPGEVPSDADLRAADIGHLQGIGGSCDADLKFWQTSWEKAVKAVNAQSTGG